MQQSAATAERLESLLGFETLIADLSSRFINLPSGDVDAEIEDALRRVCAFLGIWTLDSDTGPLLDAAPAGPTEHTLAESERELILRALESKRWHIKGPHGAAAALGLNPSTLYSRMKKLGIRLPGPREDGPA